MIEGINNMSKFEYTEDMNKRFLSIKGLNNEKLNEIN